MDEISPLNRHDNASSGSLSSSASNLPRVDSTYASAETSPRGSSSSISTMLVNKDADQPMTLRCDDLDSQQQKLTINESIIKEHKEKMQKIAVGIREYAFGKDKQHQQTSELDSPVCESKTGETAGAANSPQPQQQQFSFSLIDKMLARNGEPVAKSTDSPLSSSQQVSTVHERATSSTESPLHSSNNSTLSAASSSSPNPDFSPFKLLSNEVHHSSSSTTHHHNSNHIIHSLASAMANATGIGAQTKPSSDSADRVVIANSIVVENKSSSSSSFSAALSKPTMMETLSTTDKIIENLTSLSRKDHEKADPILSAAKNTSASPASLPASSREFCMNLNLNLAVAAAATASGPVAIVDNTMLPPSLPQQYLEHSKFTSNASTSSIHNDLKMILEESLNKNHVNHGVLSQMSSGGGDQRHELLPKPQRVAQTHPAAGDKPATTQQKTQVTRVVLSTPAPPDLLATKSSNIDLSKHMQMLIENKNKSLSSTVSPKKPMNYRYSREFLYQIRDQRSEFIQQIYPDIFQAYCYCSNGDYWDPEKYFDIIQFPTEDERMQILQQKQQSKNNYRNYQQNNKMGAAKNNGSKNLHQQKVYGAYGNGNGSNMVNSPSIESPKPLQVPKNSPRAPLDNSESERSKTASSRQQKTTNNKTTKSTKQSKKISTSVLTSLGLAEEMKISSDEIDDSTLLGYGSSHHATVSSMINSNNSDADKILLSLLKSNDCTAAKKAPSKQEKMMMTTATTTAGGKVDLLDMLNKPNNKPVETSVKPVDIVKSMFQKESTKTVQPAAKPNVPRHFPQIFSVQELEMDQIAKMKQQTSKLPTNTQELEGGHKHQKTMVSHHAHDNSAYSKLLLNLNNESKQQPASHLNSLFSKLESKPAHQKPSNPANATQQPTNEGTNILKQLLNLKPAATDSSPADQGKDKKSKKQHRHHKQSKSTKNGGSEKNSSPNVSQMSEPQHQQQQKHAQEPPTTSLQAHVVDKYALNKKTVDSNAHIEHLLNKINESKHREHKKHHDQAAKQQKDHFNSLLTKIQGQQPQGATSQSQASSSSHLLPSVHQATAATTHMLVKEDKSDILKWFTKAEPSRPQQHNEKVNWTSLNEIELMQRQRPLVSFGQSH